MDGGGGQRNEASVPGTARLFSGRSRWCGRAGGSCSGTREWSPATTRLAVRNKLFVPGNGRFVRGNKRLVTANEAPVLRHNQLVFSKLRQIHRFLAFFGGMEVLVAASSAIPVGCKSPQPAG